MAADNRTATKVMMTTHSQRFLLLLGSTIVMSIDDAVDPLVDDSDLQSSSCWEVSLYVAAAQGWTAIFWFIVKRRSWTSAISLSNKLISSDSFCKDTSDMLICDLHPRKGSDVPTLIRKWTPDCSGNIFWSRRVWNSSTSRSSRQEENILYSRSSCLASSSHTFFFRKAGISFCLFWRAISNALWRMCFSSSRRSKVSWLPPRATAKLQYWAVSWFRSPVSFVISCFRLLSIFPSCSLEPERMTSVAQDYLPCCWCILPRVRSSFGEVILTYHVTILSCSKWIIGQTIEYPLESNALNPTYDWICSSNGTFTVWSVLGLRTLILLQEICLRSVSLRKYHNHRLQDADYR